ncbi:ABC-type transport auxiliary lipoprotein family protein [Chenggangzhangella methanolivorans]|uniref:ABC-type transport auxiliary lipoprotein family protein n=1 Tax=Chenggangzhangella methanolivorans TaxID=1437009 RepID=UPI003622C789
MITSSLRFAAVLGAALSLAACSSSKPPQTFDLNAPARVAAAGGVRGNLVVAEPVAVATIDGQRIVVKPNAGEVTFLPDAQWSDRLPKLVQSKMIEAYENSGRMTSVGRPGDRLTVDYQLVTEIRAFEIDAATGQARVEISAKFINDKTGRIVSAAVFQAARPVGAISGASASQALDQALSEVLTDLVSWRTRRTS